MKIIDNTILDNLYGEFLVDDVLIDLINSNSLQRLKNIHQGGGAFLINQKWSLSRYEHSIGVMLIVKILGGTIEEQIQALLHDVSHTAFSHVVDYIVKCENEDYHESHYDSFIKNSDIEYILNKYNYNISLLNNDNFILEQNLPHLCADRIDYTLRDMYYENNVTLKEIKTFLKSLRYNGKTVYLDKIDTAVWFANIYYKEVIGFFMNPYNVFANYKLTNILKKALRMEIITMGDFLNDDNFILNKLIKSGNIDIISDLESINPNIKLIESQNNFDIEMNYKPRFIDPDIKFNNQIIPSSTISKEIENLKISSETKIKSGVKLKIIMNV